MRNLSNHYIDFFKNIKSDHIDVLVNKIYEDSNDIERQWDYRENAYKHIKKGAKFTESISTGSKFKFGQIEDKMLEIEVADDENEDTVRNVAFELQVLSPGADPTTDYTDSAVLIRSNYIYNFQKSKGLTSISFIERNFQKSNTEKYKHHLTMSLASFVKMHLPNYSGVMSLPIQKTLYLENYDYDPLIIGRTPYAYYKIQIPNTEWSIETRYIPYMLPYWYDPYDHDHDRDNEENRLVRMGTARSIAEWYVDMVLDAAGYEEENLEVRKELIATVQRQGKNLYLPDGHDFRRISGTCDLNISEFSYLEDGEYICMDGYYGHYHADVLLFDDYLYLYNNSTQQYHPSYAPGEYNPEPSISVTSYNFTFADPSLLNANWVKMDIGIGLVDPFSTETSVYDYASTYRDILSSILEMFATTCYGDNYSNVVDIYSVANGSLTPSKALYPNNNNENLYPKGPNIVIESKLIKSITITALKYAGVKYFNRGLNNEAYFSFTGQTGEDYYDVSKNLFLRNICKSFPNDEQPLSEKINEIVEAFNEKISHVNGKATIKCYAQPYIEPGDWVEFQNADKTISGVVIKREMNISQMPTDTFEVVIFE